MSGPYPRFHLTPSSNSEIAHQWLLTSVRNHYDAAYPRLEEFLTSTGREKLILPLYQELAKSPDGQQRAAAIYGEARPGYHYLTVSKLDKILAWRRT
ncbi:MAG: leukotriene A4 hydrolase C-terminal domain-containing protein [Nitrososphaera sp.]|nr:leukotriene A4 hydrolase C-terminal domain-containing protein [Nitrososphaera sp.]